MSEDLTPSPGSSPTAEGAPEAGFEFGGRLAFAVLALCALFYAYQFRVNALNRVQGPYIADSVEYLTMARYITDDVPLTVKPVRSGLFPLMLAVPILLERLWLDDGAAVMGGPEDPSIALWVLFLFNAFAIYGAYRLGRVLRGPLTGLLAAYFTALLPLFTQWSLDYLTDVPAATFGVWALVYWAERKPFRVGLMLGLAVLMRYQCLIPLAAFFAVPVLFRNWKTLYRMTLGLLPAVFILGVGDYFFWGEAFHSFMLFVPRQLTTFLPAGIVSKIFPLEAASNHPVAPMNVALEAIAAKSKFWYFERSPQTLGKVLACLLLLYPLARRSMRTKSGADMSVWIIVSTVLVLSFQRYKEARYLIAIVPIVAAIGASGALWAVTLFVKKLGHKRPLAVIVGAGLLLWLGTFYMRTSLWLQRDARLAPFGSHIEAIASIPQEARPCTIGITRPWLLLRDYPMRASGGWYWFSRDFASVDISRVSNYFKQTPDKWMAAGGSSLLDDIDYFVTPLPKEASEFGKLRWLNGHTVFDGYFYNPNENDWNCLLLRSSAGLDVEQPFWNLNDERAREGAELAEFRAGVHLISIDAKRLPNARNAVKVDTRWRLPNAGPVRITGRVLVKNSTGALIGSFDVLMVRNEDYDRRERSGVAMRETDYVSLIGRPGLEELRFDVEVDVVVVSGESPRPGLLKTPGESEFRSGEQAVFKLTIPVESESGSAAPPVPPKYRPTRSG